MALKKSRAREQIQEAGLALKEIMQRNLARASDGMTAQVIAALRNLPDSQRFDAIKNVAQSGIQDYKSELLEAMAVITQEAITQARKEVPKAKGVKLAEPLGDVKLGEFENLPPSVRKRLLSLSQLLTDTQFGDLEKALFFQFQSSVDSTDSIDLIESDLSQAGESYVTGASVISGSATLGGQLINEARQAFFYDDQVLDQIDAFEFVNGDPVTEICTDLAGTVFSKDDPEADRYQPPLHWNCKSTVVPVLKGNLESALQRADQEDLEPLKPSKASLEKQIKFHEHCVLSEKHVK